MRNEGMEKGPEASGSLDCAEVRSRLEAAAAHAAVDDDSRCRLHEHLAACDACRALAVAVDPSLLFLELRGGPLPERFWVGFPEALRARIAARRFDWLSPLRSPTLAYVTAPLVTLLVLGAAIIAVRPDLAPWRRPVGARSPYVLPSVPGLRQGAAPRVGGQEPGPPLPPGSSAPGAPRPGPASGEALEEIGSPGARVYRFSVGGPGDETPIYFIVDESIDI